MNNSSYVQVNKSGAVAYCGKDGTELARVIILKSALKLLKAGITPTRGFTITRGLASATAITQKQYKGKDKLDKAIADIELWISVASSSIPVIDEKGNTL